MNDFSHPFMLTELAVQAYQNNLQEEAAGFINILYGLDDQLVVNSIIKMALKQSVPIDDISMILFDWSVDHPLVAYPGLFMEYVSNNNLPPEERIVAAFGLAGSSDKISAEKALEKAIESERDAIVITNLKSALSQLRMERLEPERLEPERIEKKE